MSGAALKRVLSRAQMRLADRSDACEGPGWARTEHMQQESGYVVGVPKMATGAEAFSSKTLAAGRPHCRTRASCWKRLGTSARTCTHRVGLADVWTVLERVRRGLLLDRLKRARRRDPREGGWRWPGVISFAIATSVVECDGTQPNWLEL